jgi:hypothetical protein
VLAIPGKTLDILVLEYEEGLEFFIQNERVTMGTFEKLTIVHDLLRT